MHVIQIDPEKEEKQLESWRIDKIRTRSINTSLYPAQMISSILGMLCYYLRSESDNLWRATYIRRYFQLSLIVAEI